MRVAKVTEIKDEKIIKKVIPVIEEKEVKRAPLKDKITNEEKDEKQKTISFRVYKSDLKNLNSFAKSVNNTQAGAYCKKLLFDAYNYKEFTPINILKSLENFESKSKEEVINLVREFEAKFKTKRDKNRKRVVRDLID